MRGKLYPKLDLDQGTKTPIQEFLDCDAGKVNHMNPQLSAALDGEFSCFSGEPFEITYFFEPATADATPDDYETGNYIGAIKSGTLAIFASRGVFT
jgi:hypothetical protein